jgi:hypothetical protein
MKHRNRWIVVGLLFVVLFSLVAACTAEQLPAEPPAEEEQPPAEEEQPPAEPEEPPAEPEEPPAEPEQPPAEEEQPPAEPEQPPESGGGTSGFPFGLLIGLGLVVVVIAVVAGVLAGGRKGGEAAPIPTAAEAAAGEAELGAMISGITQAHVGQVVSYNARDSRAPAGNRIVDYRWDFGDGAQGAGVEVTHAYDRPGAFLVSLTVTDDMGWSHSAALQVRIEEPLQPLESAQPPVAVIIAPPEALVGQAVAFDAGYSTSESSITSHVWSFGDGATADAVQVEHAYNAAGTYNVTLTIVNQAGLQSTATRQIQVHAAPE